MALDMEGEFYKLAKKILSKPKNLYKVAAISPHTGRVTLMGADNYMVVGSSILKDLAKSKEEKAYRSGKKCGKEMFRSLIEEFDEEVANLEPKKLFELGLSLATNTGWGRMEMSKFNASKGNVIIKATDTIELKYKRSKHHMLTCGFLSGISTMAMGKDMEGRIEKTDSGSVMFSLNPV
jgi:hypothetical protein